MKIYDVAYQEGDTDKVVGADYQLDPATFDPAHSITYFDGEGHILAIATVKLLWEGLGEVHMVLSKYGKAKAIAVARHSKLMVAKAMEMFNLRKIYIANILGEEKYSRWPQLLGFELEYIMKDANPEGKDIPVFAKYNPEFKEN